MKVWELWQEALGDGRARGDGRRGALWADGVVEHSVRGLGQRSKNLPKIEAVLQLSRLMQTNFPVSWSYRSEPVRPRTLPNSFDLAF